MSTLVPSTEALSWGWEARWEGGWVILRPVPSEGGAGGAFERGQNKDIEEKAS